MTAQDYENMRLWLPYLKPIAFIMIAIGAIFLILFFISLFTNKRKKLCAFFAIISPVFLIGFTIVYSIQSNWTMSISNYESFYNGEGTSVSDIAESFSEYTSSVVERNQRMVEELPSLDDEIVTVEDTILENGARLKVDQSGKSLIVTLVLTENDIPANIICILQTMVSLQEKYSGKVDSALIMASEGEESVLLTNMTDENGTLKIGALGLNWMNETYETNYNAFMESR